MKNNFKRSYNNRLLFILILILPAITILLAGVVNKISNPSERIGILINAHKEEYSHLISILEKTEDVKWEFADEHTLKTDLIMGKYNIVLDYRDTKTINGFKALSYENEKVTTGITKAEQMISFLLTLLMITSTLNSSVIIKDKKVGTLSRFCYAPTTIFSYVGGNIVYNIILAYCQIIFALLLLKLFHIQVGISDGYFLIISFIIVLIATAFGIFISYISRSEMKANIIAACITVLFSLLGGSFVSIEKMPFLFQKISAVSPTRWIIEMTKNIEQGKGVLEPSMPLLVLMSSTLLLLIFSIVIINYNKEAIK